MAGGRGKPVHPGVTPAGGRYGGARGGTLANCRIATRGKRRGLPRGRLALRPMGGVDAALAGLIGALAGATVGGGIPPTVKGIFDLRSAKAQREHERTEDEVKREGEDGSGQ
jgi:hypothetical protein